MGMDKRLKGRRSRCVVSGFAQQILRTQQWSESGTPQSAVFAKRSGAKMAPENKKK